MDERDNEGGARGPGVAPALAERYGVRSRSRRRLAIASVAGLALVALGWLAWSAWSHATPAVQSELEGYVVVDAHEVTVTLRVDLREGAGDATCRVRALSVDHATVGELAFAPEDGRNEVSVRTERLATAVEKVGCTTPDQPRPR